MKDDRLHLKCHRLSRISEASTHGVEIIDEAVELGALRLGFVERRPYEIAIQGPVTL
jgi:hypothetical protein